MQFTPRLQEKELTLEQWRVAEKADLEERTVFIRSMKKGRM
jgi:hypothetical protein